jgi:hypothetical protein
VAKHLYYQKQVNTTYMNLYLTAYSNFTPNSVQTKKMVKTQQFFDITARRLRNNTSFLITQGFCTKNGSGKIFLFKAGGAEQVARHPYSSKDK